MQLLHRIAAPRDTTQAFSSSTTPAFSRKLKLAQPIVRPLHPVTAAKRFVRVGEFLWRDLVELYDVHAEDEGIAPLSPLMRSLFAQQLAQLCRRGQVRMTENGRRRRLTTYLVPASAELAAA